MNDPILVTGGAGFLGSWLVRRLVESGRQVRVLDLPQARWDQLPAKRVDRMSGDICDLGRVREAVRGCRTAYHLAGLPRLWAPRRGWFHRVNFRGAVSVLDEAVRAGCERIIHVSSATIWPLDGSPICQWSEAYGPYSKSKLLAERHALKVARGGAPVIVVSPTAPIGPGDISRTPPTQLLLDFCRGRRREYLDAQLNLIDVRDLADAMVRAGEVGVPGERYLLGHETLALLELFRRLSILTGQPVPQRRVPYGIALMGGFVLEFWADVVTNAPSAASVNAVRLTRRPLPADAGADLRRLGVTPRPLMETLKDTLAWFEKTTMDEPQGVRPRLLDLMRRQDSAPAG